MLNEASLKVLSEHADRLKSDKKALSNQLAEVINKINVLDAQRLKIQEQIDTIDSDSVQLDTDIASAVSEKSIQI